MTPPLLSRWPHIIPLASLILSRHLPQLFSFLEGHYNIDHSWRTCRGPDVDIYQPPNLNGHGCRIGRCWYPLCDHCHPMHPAVHCTDLCGGGGRRL